MDIDDEKIHHRLSDEQVKQLINETAQTESASDFQHLGRNRQAEILRDLRKQGASIRQLERLTGISRGLISRL